MGTLSLVLEYLKDLEECMNDGDSRVAKEAKLFDALEHKSVVIEVDNQKIAIFTKAPLRAFDEPFMRYSLPCKVDGQGSWDADLDLADSANYVTEKVLENMGFVHVSLSDYGRKMVNDVKHGNSWGKKLEAQANKLSRWGKQTAIKAITLTNSPPPSLRLEEIPPTSTIPPQPIYHPLTAKQKEKMKEVLDIKYKELEESKPILEVLENYVIYKKKLDEILIGKERLNKKEFSEEDKVGIIEHGLPKKMCDPGNYVLPVKINGVVEMVALVDTGASVSVLPYSLYKDIGLGDPRPYQTNLTMADNTQAKAIGELPLLLGRPFLRTYGAIIDMGRGMLCIDDGVIRHTYFPKPRSKLYVEAFEMEGEDDWLGSFEVGRDEDGNVKYGPIAPSFIDIEDDMERALAIEAYFNPFKNVIVFKKLVDFLGSLPVQLKNLDWGNEGYGTYKKVDGDGDWHARFEFVTPSGRKFNRAFKTKTTTRKLSGRFKTKDILSRKETLPNPLIAEYKKRNKRNTSTYSLQPVSNSNLKWRDLPFVERHAYYEKLSKLPERSFGVPRVANWRLFDGYGFEDTLREMMKLEYIYEGDGDVFVDYSWEIALSIDNEIYPEWVLEFFSTLYFDKDVDRNNLMKEKCIWFRLCGHEHILTLPEFVVVLGLFIEEEVEHRLFEVYFGKLEVDDKQVDHKDYWIRVGQPTLTNHKEVLVKEPLMRIMMSALEESRGVNLAWIIADHLYKHAPRTKENSVICAGHYVTKISCSLGYCVDEEIKKCSEPIDCDYWTSKMWADELDMENTCLKKETEMPTQVEEGSREPRHDHGGLNTSWGDWNASLSEIERGNVWRDSMLIQNNYMLEHSMPILHHFTDQGNFAYPTYEPPNIPSYPYPYIPYSYPYTHYPSPGNQGNQVGHYRLGGDDYFASAMPDFGGSSSGNAVGGSSRGDGFNDDDMDE
ncbi:retrovirus-related pol polyprotein from transposon TNT 1-94 [Tanacetum coccineum]